MNEPTPINPTNEQPPVFQHWSGWYALVLGTLVTIIILLYWFSRLFI